MNPNYLPTDRDGRLWRLVEEMGEVAQAIGKAGRFGLSGCDPLRVNSSNAAKILSEIADLRHALDAVEPDLIKILHGPLGGGA